MAFHADIGKRSITVVVKEVIGNGFEVVGMAIRSPARIVRAAVDVLRKVPIEIAADEEIWFAIVIVVKETGRRHPATGFEPGFRRNIRKSAVVIVVVKNHAAKVCDQQIGKSIVIVICRRDAHPETAPAHAGLFGNVRKGAVMIIVIKAIPILGHGFIRYLGI